MSKNKPKLELQDDQPIKLRLLHDKPLQGKNGHGPYSMYGVVNEAGEELVWFAPASAHEVIQSQALKRGSEIIVRQTGKNTVEVSIIGKAAEAESKSDNLKELMISSLRDASAIAAEAPELRLGSSDVRAIANSLFIART